MKWLRALGLLLILLAGAGWAVCAMNDLPPLHPRSRSSAFTDTDDSRLGRAIAPQAAANPGLSGLYMLTDAREAFAARILLARSAERSIDTQYYIWHSDLTGTLLFNELRAAADRGVRVRLLQDDNTTSGLDSLLAALDAHPNIEVRLFNPFVTRKPRFVGFLTDFARLNRRMHNKSFTVDNQATIIGGRNIGDEYFAAGDGALFVDLDLLAVGQAVRDVSEDFDRYWASGSSYPAGQILPTVVPGRLREVEAEAKAIEQRPEARSYVEAVRSLPIVAGLSDGRLELEWAPVRMISDDPAKGLGTAAPGELFPARLEAVLEQPLRRVGLVSGYFVPTASGEARFSAMARRGVEVDILTNAFESTDVPIVHSGYIPYRRKLLESGIRLWELRSEAGSGPGRRGMTGVGSTGSQARGSQTALHAKTFTVDGERIFVGSFNFDPRSARLNTELGFVIESPRLARKVEEAFDRLVPLQAYEVRIDDKGKLVWIERRDGREIRHHVEPGTSFFGRAAIRFLSWLPIEWLL